ncbi:MAG: hypothetical protein ACSHYF_16810 [Verrucomicrobiaceae bacterium]
MLLFVAALICAVAVLFAGIPAAVNSANRIHIENGREPNAGIAFMPELIVMVGLWWGAGAALKYFFDLPIALIAMISISSLLFIWQVIQARRSNREYAQFVANHDEGSAPDSENKTKQNKSQHPTA